jgi:MFS family permease
MTPTAEPAQGNHRATYREVLAEPRFRLLFSTRTVAITAGSLRITTFSVLVFAATGSALLSALAFGIGFLPQLFGSLLLGSLADQLPPRALIASGYALECAAALLLALVWMPIAASLGVVALVALATPVFGGASSRLVAQSLEGDAYVLGRSLNNIAASGAQLFGLALGGAVVAVLGPHRALAVSAALYLGCALAIRIRLPRLELGEFGGTPGSARGDGGAVRASLHGAGLLLRGHTVRRLMLAQWLPPAFVAGAEGLIVAYAGGRHFAPGWYAVLMGCLPVGMLVGDLLVGRLLRPPHPGATGSPTDRADGTAACRLRRRARSGCLVLSAAALRLRIRLRSRSATAVPGRPAAGWPGPGLRSARLRQHDAAGRRSSLLRLAGRRHRNGRRNRPGRRRCGADRRLDSHLAPAQ